MGLIYRALLILVVIWVAVSLVAGTALLWHSYQRMRKYGSVFRRRNTVVMECPYCDGRGVVTDRSGVWDECPMCDGESALVERVDH